MAVLRKKIFPIILAGVWISVSEFLRNEVLFKSYWIEQYERLGMAFPSEPLNGAVWGLWSLLFAVAIYILNKRYSLLQTMLLSWFVAFVMMWVVVWNLNVLPLGLLVFCRTFKPNRILHRSLDNSQIYPYGCLKKITPSAILSVTEDDCVGTRLGFLPNYIL